MNKVDYIETKIWRCFFPLLKYFLVTSFLFLIIPNSSASNFLVGKICSSVSSLHNIEHYNFTKKQLKELNDCDPSELYYGLNDLDDANQILYCAEKNQDYKILSLLYANGNGVERNLSLALHFACSRVAPEKEYNQFIEFLYEYKKKNNYMEDFNGCDAQDSFSAAVCWGLEINRKGLNDYMFFRGFSDSFRNAMKTKLGQFQIRQYLYTEHHSYYEIEDEKIPTVSYMLLEGRKVTESFLRLLKNISQCKVIESTEDEYKQADIFLNKVYAELHTNKNIFVKLDAKQKKKKLEVIKQTELYWIKYKDNMSSLSHLNCPNLPPYSVLTILTKQRTEQLQDLQYRFN